MAGDATTLEANAAMRSIVRRHTGETYHMIHSPGRMDELPRQNDESRNHYSAVAHARG